MIKYKENRMTNGVTVARGSLPTALWMVCNQAVRTGSQHQKVLYFISEAVV